MASTNPLQPTPIVDKNGVHTTRNKKVAQPQKPLGIPMNPAVQKAEPVAVAAPVLSVSERLAKLEDIDAADASEYDSDGFDQWGWNSAHNTHAQVASARVTGTGTDVRAIAKDVEDALAEFALVTDWGVPVDAMETLIRASENPHADAGTLESISGAIEWLDDRNAHTPASQIEFNLSMNPSTFAAGENEDES